MLTYFSHLDGHRIQLRRMIRHGSSLSLLLLAACMLAGCNPHTQAPASEPTSLPLSSTTAVRTTRPSATLRAATSTDTPLPSLAPSLTPTLVNTVCTPLAEHPLADLPGIISDPYRPPPPGHDERHQGVDFSYYRHGTRTTILGVGVQSVLPGRVAAALPDTYPFGNMVIIETRYEELSPELLQRMPVSPGESLYSLYAHLQAAPLVALERSGPRLPANRRSGHQRQFRGATPALRDAAGATRRYFPQHALLQGECHAGRAGILHAMEHQRHLPHIRPDGFACSTKLMGVVLSRVQFL